MTVKTIERVTHVPNSQNIQGLDGEGFERNRIADSVGTRVVYDSEWNEFQVYFYIDEVRYPDGDYFASDKDEAVACAKTMRDQGAK